MQIDSWIEAIINQESNNIHISSLKTLCIIKKEVENLQSELKDLKAISEWMVYPDITPEANGEYLVCKLTGRIYTETWINSHWSRNDDNIIFWRNINPPNI